MLKNKNNLIIIILSFVVLFLIGLVIGVVTWLYLPEKTENIIEEVIIDVVEKYDHQSRGIHTSFYVNENYYDDIFINVENTTSVEEAQGIIVNHHLLAADLIAESMLTVKDVDPETIVLISPNHFDNGSADIITSEYDFSTQEGDLLADLKTLDILGLYNEEAIFKYEHGIFNITSFIKKVWPDTKIISLVIKEKTAIKELDELVENLYENLPAKSLVIGSFDFSHYLSDSVSYYHDEQAVTVMENMSSTDVTNIDIDSQKGLYTVLELTKKLGAKSFTQVNHSSANTLLANEGENTSYITGYFSEKDNAQDEVYLKFVGDMFFDRYIRKAINENSLEYPIENMQRYFMGGDLNIGNLEGPVTTSDPQPLDPNNTTFTFDMKIAKLLADYQIDTVSLGNNHTLNYNQAGLTETKEFLDLNKINYFGHPFNTDDISIIENVRENKIGLVAYHQLFNPNTTSVVNEIKDLISITDYIVVYTHWGTEYTHYAGITQKNIAHEFVDAGADLVIGSHPHVIQGVEIYKDKAIFYSLGNFIFDQIQNGTKEGLTVGVKFGEDSTEFSLWPTVIDKFQVSLANQEKSDIMIKNIIEYSNLSDDTIIDGKIIINNI